MTTIGPLQLASLAALALSVGSTTHWAIMRRWPSTALSALAVAASAVALWMARQMGA